jgi:hypothetical protein
VTTASTKTATQPPLILPNCQHAASLHGSFSTFKIRVVRSSETSVHIRTLKVFIKGEEDANGDEKYGDLAGHDALPTYGSLRTQMAHVCVMNIHSQHGYHAAYLTSALERADRLCGLVIRVLGYRSGGPGSIPGTTRKKSSGSGTGSTQPCEYN